MKNQTITIVGILLLISLASAIYPGECEIIKFPNQDEVNFTLVSNTSSMEGFTWNKTGYDITYCFPTYLAPGNYSFEWGNYKDSLEPVVVHHYSSGGGSTTYETEYVDRNITKYIEREGGDTIGIDTPDDTKDCVDCIKKPDNSSIYFIIIMINVLLLVGIVSTILIKKRKLKQEEPEELSEDYY